MISKNIIINLALEVGFDLVGITTAEPLDSERANFEAWMSEGNHSTLDYLSRNIEKRFAPQLLVEGARSVIVCAVSYLSPISRGYSSDCRTKIASYALARDYHLTIKEMLFELGNRLGEEVEGLKFRAFTDSAPLAEKSLAVRAGLGWIGRNSLVVTPQFGSMILLGELVINHDVDEYDKPFGEQRCGSCRVCIENCPNGAILENRLIDTRRCISCRTIEREDDNKELSLHGWIFGCDSCQSLCPYNRRAPLHTNKRFDPIIDIESMSEEQLNSMSEEVFQAIAGATPLTRSGLERIRSNIGK